MTALPARSRKSLFPGGLYGMRSPGARAPRLPSDLRHILNSVQIRMLRCNLQGASPPKARARLARLTKIGDAKSRRAQDLLRQTPSPAIYRRFCKTRICQPVSRTQPFDKVKTPDSARRFRSPDTLCAIGDTAYGADRSVPWALSSQDQATSIGIMRAQSIPLAILQLRAQRNDHLVDGR
jgi:hypothetical protein